MRIIAVGDIMMGVQPMCSGFGIKYAVDKGGAKCFFESLYNATTENDVVIGNLECSLLDEESIKDSTYFCASDIVLQGLGRFDFLSVANNHVAENGPEVFETTIKNLFDNEITPLGIKNKVEYRIVNDRTVAFTAYSLIDDNIEDSPYNKIENIEQLESDVSRIKEHVDLLVLLIHWGDEYVPYPSPGQVEIGRRLIDAGVDIILGGHPHVPQCYEYYKDRLIVYSLGNFIFDHTYIKSARDSFIACIDVDLEGGRSKISMIPVIINPSTYIPEPMTQYDSKSFLDFHEGVRKSLEGNNIEQYLNLIGGYDKKYKIHRKRAKMDMKVHFIKNIFRLPPSQSIQILNNYVKKITGYGRP